MTKNENATRFYSSKQEQSVCKLLNARQQSNSGANLWNKGDAVNKEASLLIECKTVVKDKDSISVKREWLEKNKKEARSMELENHCLAFNFGPDQENYFIIDSKLMRFLVEKLEEDKF